jgi:butyryl-CoA dehydrogenase/short/branched chain acyl-CoA dehydrogenase
MVGLSQGALECAIQYSKERIQFGRTISKFQAVQFQIAEMATELEAARLMVYNAARLNLKRVPYVKEAAMAKYFSSQVAERICSQSLELFGGYGYTKEYPAEKYYRDCKIEAPTKEPRIMQLQTIAKFILD